MAQKSCVIRGRVIDRPESKELWVAPANSDSRVVEPTKVKVGDDGTFSLSIPFEKSEIYSITFKDEITKGSWRPINFMLEDGTIEFELNAKDRFEDNRIEGGKLNEKFAYLDSGIRSKYGATIESLLTKLYDELGEAAYSTEYKSCLDSLSIDGLSQDGKSKIFHRLDELRTEERMYNDEGNVIYRKLIETSQAVENEVLAKIRRESNEASLAKLYMYVVSNRFSTNKDKDALYAEIFEHYFAKRYADNPMAIKISEMLEATKVQVGSSFVDFEAPDIDGRSHRLSELIEGKVAVLDLWASWCGPCMQTSKSFIPIWERYRERGFEIVGVARERGNTKAMSAAIERLGLEWLNLVELNDEGKIWTKYGAGNSGGKVILLDRDGRIVAMDFTADELERHLEVLIPKTMN